MVFGIQIMLNSHEYTLTFYMAFILHKTSIPTFVMVCSPHWALLTSVLLVLLVLLIDNLYRNPKSEGSNVTHNSAHSGFLG